MNRLVFIDTTRKAPRPLYVRLTWYLVAALAVIAFGIFVWRPDLIVLP